MWVRSADDAIINLDRVASLRPVEPSPGLVRVEVRDSTFTLKTHLLATWTNIPDALEAIRKLVDSVDPATY